MIYPVFKIITFSLCNSICGQRARFVLSLSWAWATLKNCDSSHPILRPPTFFPLYLRAYETCLISSYIVVLKLPILYSMSLVDIVDYKILC